VQTRPKLNFNVQSSVTRAIQRIGLFLTDKAFSITVAGLLVSTASGQIRNEGIASVPKTDLIYPVLDERRTSLVQNGEKSDDVITEFSEWQAIESPALAAVFPNLRFATIDCSMRAKPGAKEKPMGLPAGAFPRTVAVDTRVNRIVGEVVGSSFEGFGDLLATNVVRIRDSAEADRVWESFCELPHIGRKGGGRNWPSIKISETEWHLGNSTTHLADGTGGNHHYIRVLLDGNQIIQSATRRNEKIPDRKVE